MSKKLFLIITLLLCKFSYAQHRPSKLWDATFGGSDYETFSEIKQTADKGFILCGNSSSPISGDKTQDRKGVSGFTDFWVVKTDSMGNKIWDKTYGGRYSDYATSIILTKDGGYLVGGYSESDTSGDKSQLSKGGKDYWVIKITANGVKQWDATFGGSRDENLTALVQKTGGGYLLGGYSDSRITGDKTQENRDLNTLRTDFWIVSIDSIGQKQWDGTYGGTNHDLLQDIVKSTDGGYLLAGETYSDQGFEKSSYSRGVSDYWIVKINQSGVKQWDATFGGNQLEVFKCAIQTKDGGYLLGGGSRSGISGEKTDTCRGFEDSWLVKVDSIGRLQWNSTFGGDGQEYVESIIQNLDGGYIYATSSSSNIVGDKSQDKMGNFDYWVLRIDSVGKKIWDSRYGGSGDDYLFSMIQSKDYGLVLGGQSNSGISADKSQAGRGGLDFWILKLLNNTIRLSLNTDTLCMGSTAFLNYDIAGTFNSNNKFFVKLSNSNGNFTGLPDLDTFIVSGSGHFTGQVSVTIPGSTVSANQYRLRIISSNPADTFITRPFVIRNCCSNFGRPLATNHTGELYGTNNCAGEKIFLETIAVNGATGYHWVGPAGFVSNLQNPVIDPINLTNSGIYTVYAFNLACTSDTSSVSVTVHPLPATPTVSNTGPYIVGDTIRLRTGSSATLFDWIGPYPFTSSLRNPVIPHAILANAGIYKLKINTGGICWSLSDSTHVIVNPVTSVNDMNSSITLNVYPNPLKGGNTLSIECNMQCAPNQMAKLRLYDKAGRLILKKESTFTDLMELNVPKVATGEYYLHVIIMEKMILRKLIIE
ncbi:MAG: T9SS type A sorting domain-containing protein [Bacteroidia bacterium]|nr:T9SS type A sorting domain-containing protein [Bacteroidia bacterium]